MTLLTPLHQVDALLAFALGDLAKYYPILIGVAIFAVILIFLVVLSKFYVRASKELAFVRTGLGGQKVIADGGALVIPIFQQITAVNMMTLRLLVERAAEEALITLDRVRADVKAEFFVRVKKDQEAISQAAQCFGNKTLHPEQMRELLQAKFVDALRAVAAGMDMQTLHEKRADFVQSVQTTVAEDLAKNGLELETVSLTGFDQTNIEYFNPDNSFDAQGLATMSKIIQAKREERNKIEQETRIRIEQKNLETEQQSLAIKQQQEFAILEQARQIAMQRAEQEALVKQEQARRRREAEEAEILAQKQIALQTIQKELEVEQSKIEKQQQVETSDISRRQSVEISTQEAAISVAAKSEEKSRAEALAAKALAEKIAAEEAVTTVKVVAAANREKEVAVIAAMQEAEKQATAVTVAAEAEKQAAVNLAEAKLTQARAEAEAIKIRAEADQKRFEIEAYGARAINEAKNILNEAVMSYELRRILSEVAPALVAASVKPMEKIESIRVISTNGPLIGGSGNGESAPAANGSVPDQLVNALLRHRIQMPLIDDILKQLGISEASPSAIASALQPPSHSEGSPPQAGEAGEPKSSGRRKPQES